MKKIYFISNVIFFVISSFINVNAQSYKIKVKINGLHGDSLYLGHYYAEKLYAVDTCKLDNKGVGTFSKKKVLDGGLYAVLFPTRKMSFFEIIISDDQDMFLETDTSDYVLNMKVTGSKENELFYAFQKKMADMKSFAIGLQKRYTANKDNKDSTKYIAGKLDSIDKVKDAYWEKEIKDNPNTLFAKIVKAMSNVKIPDPTNIDKNAKGYDSLVSVYRYNYNIEHFFDNIDFTDPRLLRTPFVESRLKEFYEKNIIPNFDSLTNAAIKVIEKSKVNKEFFKYVVITSTNYFLTSQIMGMDGVFVNLAEKYYLSGQATWADTSVMKSMTKYVNQFKPNMLGKVGHDLKLETNTGETVTLHQIKAKYTVLVFWEPSCGHCKKEIPLMYEKYTKWKEEGVEVLCVYTQVDEKEWNDFIEKHGITDWINAFDRYQRSSFRAFYNVDRTPTVYLLDEKKIIIAKRLGVEDLDKMLDRLLKKDVKK